MRNVTVPVRLQGVRARMRSNAIQVRSRFSSATRLAEARLPQPPDKHAGDSEQAGGKTGEGVEHFHPSRAGPAEVQGMHGVVPLLGERRLAHVVHFSTAPVSALNITLLAFSQS